VEGILLFPVTPLQIIVQLLDVLPKNLKPSCPSEFSMIFLGFGMDVSWNYTNYSRKIEMKEL